MGRSVKRKLKLILCGSKSVKLDDKKTDAILDDALKRIETEAITA